MVTITADILKEIAPGSKKTNYTLLADLASAMNTQFPAAKIDTVAEVCHFLAQAAEETDSFNSLKEYASGQEYEGRKDLGNNYPGYGVKYKGRGIFMVTGSVNYFNLTCKCPEFGISFISHPELLETPHWAVWSALIFWNDRHLSDIANRDDSSLIFSKTLNKALTPLQYITFRINGGQNGLEYRQVFYDRAKKIFDS